MKYGNLDYEKLKESIIRLRGNPHGEALFNNLVHLREDSVKQAYSPSAIKDVEVMKYYVAHVDLLDEILSPIREVYDENFSGGM